MTLFAGPLGHALGWTLLHFCWQGALVAAVLWCALELLRGRSSQVRYAAACCALGLTVALPVATFARLAAAEQRTVHWSAAVEIGPAMVLPVGAVGASAPWPVRLAAALDRAVPWVLLAWGAGVVLFVGRLNLGLVVARRMKSVATQAVGDDLQEVFEALRLRLGVVRAVTLVNSALVRVPTVIGWLRPVVLVPVGCLMGLSAVQVEALLAHELAHIRRHDYLVSVLQAAVEALLFYHPAVWWVSRQVRRERECCCDDLAVAVGGDRLAYARALSVLEERRSYMPEFVLGANGGELTMRIKRLLGCKEDAAVSQFAAFTVLAILLAVAGSYVVTVARAEVSALVRPARVVSPMEVEPATPFNTLIATPRAPEFQMREPIMLAQAEAPAAVDSAPKGDGSIAGTVLDATGAPVPHAKVATTNTDSGIQVSSETDNSGRYSISSLLPGNYNVEFVAEGFQRTLQENVRVDSGKTTSLNLKLKAAYQLILEVPPVPALGPVRTASVFPGAPHSLVDPVYPEEAKEKHIGGQVVLHAVISTNGTVENPTVVSGPQELRQSAIDAVKQWTYNPYLKNGQAVEVEKNIMLLYNLPDSTPVTGPVPPANEAANGVKQIGGGVTAPRILFETQPKYTELARTDKVQGAVLVGLVVDEQGIPQRVQVLRGVGDGLDEKAVEAVSQYKFRPSMEDGKPVAVALKIEVNFQIF